MLSAFKALLESSQDGYALLSAADGQLLFANSALREILQAEPADRSALHQAGLDVSAWLMVPGQSVEQDCWVFGKVYRLSVQPHHTENGDLLLVTLRTKAAQIPELDQLRQLRHSRAYQIIESMGQGITVLDATGHFEYVNPAYARMVGYSREELIGKEPANLTLPADLPLLEQAKQRRLAGETTVYDSHLVGKDGQIIDVLVTAVPMLKQSHSLSAITVITNLAERRREAEQLRHSSDAMRRMYEIISSTDLNFQAKIRALLRMGCELFGMQTGVLTRVSGGQLEVLLSVDSTGYFAEGATFPLGGMLSSDVLQSDGPLAFESVDNSRWSDHPAPARFNVQSYLGARVMAAGEAYGTLNFASQNPHPAPFAPGDLEFLRLLAQWVGGEIEREKYLHTLQDYANQIEQKSADLAEARDQALQASRVKSEFLAMMSHEIRTPLNAVIGMNELLLAAGLNAEQSEYSRVARDAAHALLTLIDDILDFSKIEAGKLTLETAPFELEPAIRSVVQMFAPRARQKGLDLRLEFAPGMPRSLQGDSLRLRQVLINLVGNAVKFTEKGEITVRLSVQPDAGDSVVLHCAVEDTGPGLSVEASKRVFEPFTQADGSTTRKYGGTGLGLAISQQLVELMGGSLGVDSQEGQGACFWFTVRLQPDGSVEEVAHTPQRLDRENLSAYTDTARLSLSRPLVLLAEDNPANRRLAIAQLRRLGYEVEAVSNGKQVVRAVKRRSAAYALLLLDCRMPEMDGFSAARAVRELERSGEGRIPIVAMTANSLKGDREACLAAGMDDYITKPVTLEKLKRTLESWVSQASQIQGSNSGEAVVRAVIESLRSLAEEGEDFLGELIEVYLNDSGNLISRMLSIHPNGTVEELREVVHALKGSSGSLGARRLADLCAAFEKQLVEGLPPNHWHSQLERIQKEHALVAEELQLVRAGSGEKLDKSIP